MEILASVQPILQVALDRRSSRVLGDQDDYEVGIDDDCHLQRRPTVELFSALSDELNDVDRLAFWEALTQGGQPAQRGQTRRSSSLYRIVGVPG